MNKWLWIVAGWLAASAWVQGQVTVEITQEKKSYLPREAIILGVRITNLSGRTIELGKDPNWLQFLVERKAKGYLTRASSMPVKGEFEIESSKVATRYVNLAPYYDLTIPGRYRVSAVLNVPQLELRITSDSLELDIVKGVGLWEQAFGVPVASDATNAPPEFRKYVLQQASDLEKVRLYLSVTDAVESRIMRVTYLGPMVSFSRPEAQIDIASDLYVLWQTGARTFQFVQVGTDGRIKVRQTYTFANFRPKLKKDPEGTIRVMGGLRRVTDNDYPPRVDAPTDVQRQRSTTNAPPPP